MAAFPLTNVMRLKRNLFASRDKSWQRILAIFIQRRRMRVFLQKQHGEPLQKHAWRGWNKHKHKWPQSASVAVSEPHCTADVCSVNCLSINGRESPLYSREATYEVL